MPNQKTTVSQEKKPFSCADMFFVGPLVTSTRGKKGCFSSSSANCICLPTFYSISANVWCCAVERDNSSPSLYAFDRHAEKKESWRRRKNLTDPPPPPSLPRTYAGSQKRFPFPSLARSHALCETAGLSHQGILL